MLYSKQIALALREWQNGQRDAARDLLAECRLDFRGWEYDFVLDPLQR